MPSLQATGAMICGRGAIVNTASVAACRARTGAVRHQGEHRRPRLGGPAEFADAVRFCLTNCYLNAEVIRLDGATRLPPKQDVLCGAGRILRSSVPGDRRRHALMPTAKGLRAVVRLPAEHAG